MTYTFNASIIKSSEKNMILATALNGIVYFENKLLHVINNIRHYIYKIDSSPAGWYARNLRTCDDIYLGAGAYPTIELENLDIKDTDAWAAIEYVPPNDAIEN